LQRSLDKQGDVRKGLTNLAYLRQIAHHATGRFLKAQAVALHTALSRSAFDRIVAPSHQGGKRVPGLRLGAPRAMLLLEALGSVGLLLRAFRHGDLRRCILGLPHAPERYSPTQMSYDLRKLCGKGLIRKVPGKNLYTVTDSGHRAAQFFPKLYHRALTPTCQVLLSPQFQPALAHSHDSIDRAVAKVYRAIDQLVSASRIAA